MVVVVIGVLFALSNPRDVVEAANRMIHWLSDHVSYNFYEEKDIEVVPQYTLGYVPKGYVLDVDEYKNGGVISYIDNNYFRAWDGEESSMMWVNRDKTIDYCIMGIFSEEELLKIQESIQKNGSVFSNADNAYDFIESSYLVNSAIAIENFLDDCCVYNLDGKISSENLYEYYVEYQKNRGKYPCSLKAFVLHLNDKEGIEKYRTKKKRFIKGISLK